ncbi:citrate lyase acyl carrier protein [Pseudomonas aeruginosa]|nr:citrate lyase acyl carrier protein [Pseudomonas aeruginosa]
MKIIKNATAGTVESSDIMITVKPIESTENTIELESSVEKQFGNQIRQVITTTLEHLDVQGVAVKAIDKGALDCTIKARMITVLHRGAEKETYDWKELDSWNV